MQSAEKIYIRDLSARCIIGINEHERRERQDVLINMELWADLHEAMMNDDIACSVDYKAINKKVLSFVENSSFRLIEKLASEIASICLSFPGVMKVRVSVEKPGALRFARSVGIEVVREK
ncbi:MAG: dihydroneopterin aldolase [Methanomassiliicoccales archaeon]